MKKTATHRARRKPRRLSEKLLRIRESLQLTQEEMARRFEDYVKQKHISSFETGEREPDLLVLIRYAEIANICLDILVNDKYDLPEKIPGLYRHLPKE